MIERKKLTAAHRKKNPENNEPDVTWLRSSKEKIRLNANLIAPTQGENQDYC